ncbi:aldo/keto reductase [Idiomarina sp.]|uniref:aldo/keto reductase n=1 Tax=Idiomarina sp. TaxID=1874361 RepID=UPI003A8E924B
MSYVAVLQARTNSSRLPGKVLLPIKGIPLVVLAARRAANKGIDVVVATSKEESDDALVRVLQEYGIPFYRGSLNNTLERIVGALSGFDDETRVFRLTADNVVPDGQLLEEIAKDFEDRKLDYICCNGVESGLPYGLSAELTYLKHLREAAISTQNKDDQEHVTPFIRRRYGTTIFNKYKQKNLGHYRCTVDCLDDYLALENLFLEVRKPIEVTFTELLSAIEKKRFQPRNRNPASKLIVGTAQFGLNYGIANTVGQPTPDLVEAILKTAITNGIEGIDTARAYGNSEKVIGYALKSGWMGRVPIITKLSPLDDCPKDADETVINAFVDCSIYQSMNDLGSRKLDVVMLHRTQQLNLMKGKVLERLLQHKDAGRVNSIGASVQTPEELEIALNNKHVSYIQMPYNLLDWRWDEMIPLIHKKQKERGLKVHVRSALLQGLLTSYNTEHWAKAHVDAPQHIIEWLQQLLAQTQTHDLSNLCLNFVRSQNWVNGVVVGMESLEQLNQNIKTFCEDEIRVETLEFIQRTRPVLKEETLNPALWEKA